MRNRKTLGMKYFWSRDEIAVKQRGLPHKIKGKRLSDFRQSYALKRC